MDKPEEDGLRSGDRSEGKSIAGKVEAGSIRLRGLRLSVWAILMLVATISIGLMVAGWLYSLHVASNAREFAAIESGPLDIYGYETENVFPNWLVAILPGDWVAPCDHITQIDLQFNDLSQCDPLDVRRLHDCVWVHTLHIPNVTLSAEMFAAVTGFPGLRHLVVRDWYPPMDNHDVDLRKVSPQGILVTLVK